MLVIESLNKIIFDNAKSQITAQKYKHRYDSDV